MGGVGRHLGAGTGIGSGIGGEAEEGVGDGEVKN